MEQELAIKLSQIVFQIQVEISFAIADFCFALDPRPLLVFVDRPVHLARAQMIRDKETRSYLRKKGCKTLELAYDHYSDKKRDKLYQEIQETPRRK
ncbi:hypothetical protein E6H32_09460 [Candidatus Bathyarchaeota archaeon]|nr:MAG: hypothetical protein E6H32_09460 [Candidatus Bathyarchaeota archaeon]